jgi:hypothetical protein
MRKVNVEQFVELYNKGYNDSEISRIMNVNHVTIKNNREVLNLPSNFKYKRKFDENEFKKLYDLGYNDCKISEILKISNSAVQDYRKQKGMKSNHNIYEDVVFSFEQEQLIIGGLLGDTHFRKNYANASGEFVHGLAQEEYCKWKREILKDFCSKIYYSYQIDKRTSKKYEKVICRIYSHPVFNGYYNLFYRNKVKYISKEMLWRLEGLGLAIWYMDDGCKNNNTYSIATNCFSEEDFEIIKDFFFQKFNIEVTRHNNGVTYILKKSAPTFKLLIQPYVIDSMKYKL